MRLERRPAQLRETMRRGNSVEGRRVISGVEAVETLSEADEVQAIPQRPNDFSLSL